MSKTNRQRFDEGKVAFYQRKLAAAIDADIQAKRVELWGARGWDFLIGSFPEAEDVFGNMNVMDLEAAYSKSDIVFACINEKTTSFAEAPLRVVYGPPDEVEEATDHEALALFYENPDFCASDIFGFMVSRYDLTGATFNMLGKYVDGSGAGEFTPLPTHPMSVVADGPSIKAIVMDQGEEDPIVFKPEEICLVMRRDPRGYQLYTSALKTALREYMIDRERQSLSFEVLKNRKLPAAIIQAIKGDPAGMALVSKANRDKLGESLDAAIGGSVGKRGGTLTLPPGVEWAKGADVEDIDFTVLASLSESRICMAFQVPPILIAAKAGLDRATYSNYGEARKSFYRETMLPLWAIMADGLTRAIFRQYGETEMRFEFDTRQIAELKPEKAEVATVAVALKSGRIITLNEARAMMELDPVDGGDEIDEPPPPPMPFGGGRQQDERRSVPTDGAEGEEEGKASTADYADWGAKASIQDSAIGGYPAAGKLERALKSVFEMQRKDVVDLIARGGVTEVFEFPEWRVAFAAAIGPVLEEVYLDAGKGAIKRVLGKRHGDIQAKAVNEQIEGAFNVFRPEAREAMNRQLMELVDKIDATTIDEVEAAVLNAVKVATEANTIPNLTKAVMDVFDRASFKRARVIAITESSRAVHDGQILAGAKTGIVKGYMAVVSSDACDVCQYYDSAGHPTGVPVYGYQSIGVALGSIGDYESKAPPFHPNCLVGETPVVAPGKRAAFVAPYRGPVIKLTLTDGRRLTVTPNHMFLTPLGFASAQALEQGDEILDCPEAERVAARDPNYQHGPATISEVVRALAEAPGMSTRGVPVAAEYLHGDGAFGHGNVNVVAPNSMFEVGVDPIAALLNHRGELLMDGLDAKTLAFPGRSDLRTVLLGLALATDRGVGLRRQSKAFALRQARHPQLVGVGAGSDLQSEPLEPQHDGGPTYAEPLAECQDRFSSIIRTAKVLRVDRDFFSGHVYDLQSDTTLYTAHGLVSSNCRCTMVEILDDEEAPSWEIGRGWTFTPKPGGM